MIVLAFDTATSAIGAAVHDGTQVLAAVETIDTRRHTEALAPEIEKVLRDSGIAMSDVTHIGVGIGPGPFTGLRVGIVTALTLGYALQIPVHGICSLDALAHQAAMQADGELLVATDARRKEVYWARYAARAGRAHRRSEPTVTRPADLDAALRELPSAGRGPVLYPDLFPNALAVLDVSAASVAELTVHEVADGRHTEAVPMYLRRPDAQEPGAPKATVARRP